MSTVVPLRLRFMTLFLSSLLLLLLLHTASAAESINKNHNNNNIHTRPALPAWSFPPGTTAVVTGGTKGIGRAIVEELASYAQNNHINDNINDKDDDNNDNTNHGGLRILTCARNPTELQDFVAECQARGWTSVEGVVADVSTAQGRSDFVEQIELFLGTEGRLDILVNNVGTNIRKSSVDYTPEELEFIWNTNFNSMFGLTTACHKFLKRPTTAAANGMKTASVVNIGSVAGVTCVKTGTPYSATKAAMNQITGNWACEWGPDGIRVNCVTPWYDDLT